MYEDEAVGGVEDEAAFDAIVADEDLWQFEDRHKWYLPKYAADDAPDWNPATFVHSHPACNGAREVVLEVEISRELVHTAPLFYRLHHTTSIQVPIRNAYIRTGQHLQIRVNGGEVIELPGT